LKRHQLEHIVRAAADVTSDEIVVVGSQAVLIQFPNAPPELLTSLEADVYPRANPERAIEIDGALGDGSPFHELYGYYAHGVGPETPIAPEGWEDRLVRMETHSTLMKSTVTGWGIEIHDLVLSKLAAGRQHDYVFVEVALQTGIVDLPKLRELLLLMPESHRDLTRDRLEGLIARLTR
jgi:hypothetical protein